MGLNWTKEWTSVDDGTLLKGLDLKNIQDDIDAGIGNATQIQGKTIDAPVTGDDGFCIFWDDTNDKFDYKAFVDIASNQTIAGEKTFTDDATFNSIVKFKKGADVASATSIALGDDGNYFDITGTTTIQTITAKTAGTVVYLYFDSALTLTDNTGNLELNGNDVAIKAEDVATFICDGTNWIMTALRSSAGDKYTEVFTANGNWTAPVGVNYVEVSMCGGGGGGASHSNGGGGGGGGAAIVNHGLIVTPGQQYAITIGTGGTGEQLGGGPEDDGGDTTFVGKNYTLTAPGGTAGSGGSGGAGGTASASLTGGNANGGAGAAGGPYVYGGGAGGDGASNHGGGGGGSMMGPGGAGGTDNVGDAENGQGPGGGGGGGDGSGLGQAGGDGVAGIVIIKYGVNGTPS